ncbi:unnamed protein product [Effrenium voratum]|nr:unnamed protein product [Effrenium voratum]
MEDSGVVLEAQRKAHPELGETLEKIEKYVTNKLYHQLTQTLLEYLSSPTFAGASAAPELKDFFESFIKDFENKFDKVRWVQILSIVTKPQTPAVALEILAPFEASMAESRDAKYLWQTLKGEKLTYAGETDAAKELLDNLGAEIEAAYEVQALIQSHYHKTMALLYKTLARPQEFYKSSILYLAFTPLEAIPVEERPRIAFETVVSALVAEEEFNFGELTQQEIIPSLDGSQYAWVRELLQAFSDGKFETFDAAIAKNKAQMEATPELKSAGDTLRRKMCALSLMELAFRKPKKQRRLNFAEIAQHCRVGASEALFVLSHAEEGLEVRLLAEPLYLADAARGGQKPDVLHPWPIRDVAEEQRKREAGASAGVILRDGLEFLVEASPSVLPPEVEVGVFIGFFSASHTSNEAKVEDWMLSGGTPPEHNPLRLWTMFSYQYPGGVIQPDEYARQH